MYKETSLQRQNKKKSIATDHMEVSKADPFDF